MDFDFDRWLINLGSMERTHPFGRDEILILNFLNSILVFLRNGSQIILKIPEDKTNTKIFIAFIAMAVLFGQWADSSSFTLVSRTSWIVVAVQQFHDLGILAKFQGFNIISSLALFQEKFLLLAEIFECTAPFVSLLATFQNRHDSSQNFECTAPFSVALVSESILGSGKISRSQSVIFY